MIVSLIVFFTFQSWQNKEYYKQNIKLTKKDILNMIIVFFAMGISIILMFYFKFLYAFLCGSFINKFRQFFNIAN